MASPEWAHRSCGCFRFALRPTSSKPLYYLNNVRNKNNSCHEIADVESPYMKNNINNLPFESPFSTDPDYFFPLLTLLLLLSYMVHSVQNLNSSYRYCLDFLLITLSQSTSFIYGTFLDRALSKGLYLALTLKPNMPQPSL